LFSAKKINNTKFYEEALDEIRWKINNLMHPTMFYWDLEIDLAFNDKFYFKKYNPDEVANLTRKKKKSPSDKKERMDREKLFGYRRRKKL
jgi:hypothetical protein